MNKKIKQYQVNWFFRKIKRKLTGKSIEFNVYAGREIMQLQEANDMIAHSISEGLSFAAGRLGATELQTVWKTDLPQNKEEKKRILNQMKTYSGFFPMDTELLQDFSNIMKNACGQMDLLAVWFNEMEDYIIDMYGGNCRLTYLRALEPWYVEHPWTGSLKGKKVLIIHPFADTIKKQYEKRDFLFKNKEILPEFKALYTVKAVQTIANAKDDRFKTWFEALDWMFAEAMKTDFEVAIIGCGAYGFPLAAKIKSAGRSAIHMGGATQLLFGIKGNRWDTHPVIGKLYNEYWVRPDDSEKPEGLEAVEGGCYW